MTRISVLADALVSHARVWFVRNHRGRHQDWAPGAAPVHGSQRHAAAFAAAEVLVRRSSIYSVLNRPEGHHALPRSAGFAGVVGSDGLRSREPEQPAWRQAV